MSKEHWFWRHVSIGGPDTCWPWQRSCVPAGYGVCYPPDERRQKRTHRVAFVLHNGMEPNGEVMHTCDNPPCCNPAHLRDGTHRQNMLDMWRKGRAKPGYVRGAEVGTAKLNEGHVAEIKAALASGPRGTVKRLSEEYGVDRQTIWTIKTGKRWGHVSLRKWKGAPKGALG